MAAKRLVQIGIAGPTVFGTDDLQIALEAIGQWLRISGHAWILYTDASFDRIRKTIHSVEKLGNASLFISDVDLVRADGWLPRELWDWLNARGYVQ